MRGKASSQGPEGPRRPGTGPRRTTRQERARARARLAPLGALPHAQVAAEDDDPRGWEVIAADGRGIGRVQELIVDREAGKVRYLDCALEPDAHHILVPIGYVRLDGGAEHAIVDALTSAQLAALPPFLGLPLLPAFEDELLALFRGGYRTHRVSPPAPARDARRAERRRGDRRG